MVGKYTNVPKISLITYYITYYIQCNGMVSIKMGKKQKEEQTHTHTQRLRARLLPSRLHTLSVLKRFTTVILSFIAFVHQISPSS